MRKITMLVLMVLSVNANAQSGDSTGFSLAFLNSIQRTTTNDYKNSQAYQQRINVPTREIVYNQPIYITNPPTEPPPPTTVACSSYTMAMTGYRLSSTNLESSDLAAGMSGLAKCGRPAGSPTNGVIRNNRQSNECLVGAWFVPVYQNVCTG